MRFMEQPSVLGMCTYLAAEQSLLPAHAMKSLASLNAADLSEPAMLQLPA